MLRLFLFLCIMLHFAPHAMNILTSPHTYAFARSCFREARAGDPKESMVVHKCQVSWMLTYLWIKASTGAFNQYSLSFILNLALCYSWLCIRLIGVV
jgi:hypothetical protein